jgi:hypothetical protein
MKLPPPLNSYYGLGMIVENDEKNRVYLSHVGVFTLDAKTMFEMPPSETERLDIVVFTNGYPLGISPTSGTTIL